MTTINLHEAKARLSHYARLVKGGETIVLCDRNRPFAEIRPLSGNGVKKRRLGLMKGSCPVGKEFFSADKEIAESLIGGGVFPVGGANSNLFSK